MHDGVGNADPADQERGKADQCQEFSEPPHILFETRRRARSRTDFPARIWKKIARLRLCRVQCRPAAVGKPHPITPAHEASWLHQPRRKQSFLRDDQARAEADARRDPVGLIRDGGRDQERRVADLHFGSRRDTETQEQRGLRHRTEAIADAQQRIRQGCPWIEFDLSGQGIGAIDCLQFNQCRGAARRARHCAH